jgi:AraC family transcriptional regulator
LSPPVSASQFVSLLPALPDVSAAWNTFSLQRVDAPRHLETTFADHVVTLHISGAHHLRQVLGGRVSEGRSDPGALNVIPAGVDMLVDMAVDLNAAARGLVLFIPPALLSRVVAEHWSADPTRVELVRHFLIRDRVIESVMTRLAVEAKRGSPLGNLYAESACEFLAHHIICSYSSLSGHRSPTRGGLTGRRLKTSLDYIHDSLGQRISLHALAASVGISARHFERAFRQAVGVPPHAYVTEQRLAAARHFLLAQPRLTIEDIARRVGFSSSSHLATAFRRQTGVSPRAFRALHLR